MASYPARTGSKPAHARTWYSISGSDQILNLYGSRSGDAHASFQVRTISSKRESASSGDFLLPPRYNGPRAPGDKSSPSPLARRMCILRCDLTRSELLAWYDRDTFAHIISWRSGHARGWGLNRRIFHFDFTFPSGMHEPFGQCAGINVID